MAFSALDAFPGIVADAATVRVAFHVLAVQNRGGGEGSFAVGSLWQGHGIDCSAHLIHSLCSIFGTDDKPSATEGSPRAASAIERHLSEYRISPE